jgi:hypothetical protein
MLKIQHSIKSIEQGIVKLQGYLSSKWSIRAIIALGIIFRVTEYLHNRSFNETEAPLAMNIIHRSYADLLNVAGYVQTVLTAPPGFAFVEKFTTGILGNTELAFRIFPLAAGIISVFLFLAMARRHLDRAILPIALFFFATNDYLILFSSEAKQYSSDVAIAIGLVMFALWIVTTEMTAARLLFFGFLGAITFWFSHSALFVYAGGAIIILYAVIREGKWQFMLILGISTIVALASFVVMYIIALRDLSLQQNLLTGFQGSFVTLVPTSFSDVLVLGYCLLRTIKNPMGLFTYDLGLAAVSFVVGMVFILRKRPYMGALTVAVFFFTLLASSLRKYPFEGRLLLFTTPLMTLALAQGLHYIYRVTKRGSPVMGFALVALLIAPSAFTATYHLFKPRTSEELRPVMLYLRKRHRSGDIVYLYYATRNAFQYYAERYRLEHIDYIISSPARVNPENYFHELNKLRGNHRVWIVFSHIFERGVDEEVLFVSYLKSIGTLRESFNADGAALYLFDLSYAE